MNARRNKIHKQKHGGAQGVKPYCEFAFKIKNFYKIKEKNFIYILVNEDIFENYE